MERDKRKRVTKKSKFQAKSKLAETSKAISREILEARIREAREEMSRRHLEETGEQLYWGPLVDPERMLGDPEHMAKAALEDLEAALARPTIGFEGREILKRCDGIINAGWERLLTKGDRRRLLQGREELAARLEKAKKPEEERRILRIAENLLDIAKTERRVKEEADVVVAFLKKRKVLYRQFHALLDKVSEDGFCRCTEAVWDQWVHGGPAEFLQDLNVYYMKKILPLIQAEAERKGMPELIPSPEEYASAMRRSYPGESHLTEGLMDKSYGFVVPLPLLPRHIAKYVTSRYRKQWYVTWMHWYLSYGATVYPRSVYWRRALAASYEPLVRKLEKKARRLLAQGGCAREERKFLFAHVRTSLRAKLLQGIAEFNFFYKKSVSLGRKKALLPSSPRSATLLSSIEIPFAAYIEDKLRHELEDLLRDYLLPRDEGSVGPVGVGEAVYEPEDREAEGLSVVSPVEANYAQWIEADGVSYVSRNLAAKRIGIHTRTLLRWRQAGKISGRKWGDLSRSAKQTTLHGRKAPPRRWYFYSVNEVERIRQGSSRARQEA